MKKILGITILLLFLCQNCANAVYVPQDTTINIGVKRLVQSKGISNKYEISAKLKEDVIINGVTIFSIGNKAILFVEDYEKAKGFGRGGKIDINGGFAYDNNGNKHTIKITKSYIGNDRGGLWKIVPFKKGEQAKILPSETFETKLKTAFNYKKEKQSNINRAQKNKNTTVQVGIGNFKN